MTFLFSNSSKISIHFEFLSGLPRILFALVFCQFNSLCVEMSERSNLTEFFCVIFFKCSVGISSERLLKMTKLLTTVILLRFSSVVKKKCSQRFRIV